MRETAVAFAVLGLFGRAWAQVTERVSVNSLDRQLNGGADLPWPPSCAVSDDGRYVIFFSGSSNVVSGDTNGTWDVYLRDRQSGVTMRMSVDSQGAQANGFSGLYGITITPDGRVVAFESRASNLVSGDTNGSSDVFLRDRVSGTTERVSVATAGAQGNSSSHYPAITPDGRYVAFASAASNLVSGDTNGVLDIFVRDRLNGTTERVSVATGGAQGNQYSDIPCISADGRFVGFHSTATNLVTGDTNGKQDAFVHDRLNGTTERVSTATGGAEGNGNSGFTSISGDGRFVAFVSDASNLVSGDTNNVFDVFVRDLQLGTTERVSIGVSGVQGGADSNIASISSDGRYVSFQSFASNLVPGDSGGLHIFVRDRLLGTTERVSIPTGGMLTTHDNSANPSISSSGRFVVFRSDARNLVPGDSNGQTDVFLHDRGATGFTSLCDLNTGGVTGCPCSNPPSGSGRGCDNSSGTGGSSLSASGIAYLSIDSLVFTTSGEPPTAFSIVMQGNTLLTSGVVYGQGVRCVGGATKRLFTKTAVAGSITAPDFGAGDPTVSARSAAKGDVIQPGQSRYYLVYYRDPNVLGGCPASSTFNATQTGQIAWSL